jgi:hypothetical protein
MITNLSYDIEYILENTCVPEIISYMEQSFDKHAAPKFPCREVDFREAMQYLAYKIKEEVAQRFKEDVG